MSKQQELPQHQQQEEQQHHQQYSLLGVPFYVYPELNTLERGNFTDGYGNPFKYVSMEEWMFRAKQRGHPSKHGDDYYFAQTALRHPMRTSDPTKAKLFLIPLLVNAISETMLYEDPVDKARSVCWHYYDDEDEGENTNRVESKPNKMLKKTKTMCNRELIRFAHDVLSESEWFRRSGGKDHLLVGGHWNVRRGLYNDADLIPPDSPLRFTNTVTFEKEQFSQLLGRYTMPSTYVGEGCHSTGDDNDSDSNNIAQDERPPKKTHDFVFIASTPKRQPFREQFCDSLRSVYGGGDDGDNSNNNKIAACGTAPKCPTLARARFGFHVRGDTYGANRPIDTLLSWTVPIFTHRRQYDVLPPFVDWKNLTYLVDLPTKLIDYSDASDDESAAVSPQDSKHLLEDDRKLLKSELDAVLRDESGYKARMEAIRRNRDLFDYATPVPFDLYMYGLQCHLYPGTCFGEESKKNERAVRYFQSRYPALRLPSNQREATFTTKTTIRRSSSGKQIIKRVKS